MHKPSREIITPIKAFRRPMKGVATGIPENLKIRSLDYVRPAMVMDRMALHTGELLHECDKHGRHHRITFKRPVDGQTTSGQWTDIRKGTFYVHLGRTYVAYNRNLFDGRICDADLLANRLKCPVKALAKV